MSLFKVLMKHLQVPLNLGFTLIDAELYALFKSGIFKIKLWRLIYKKSFFLGPGQDLTYKTMITQHSSVVAVG